MEKILFIVALSLVLVSRANAGLTEFEKDAFKKARDVGSIVGSLTACKLFDDEKHKQVEAKAMFIAGKVSPLMFKDLIDVFTENFDIGEKEQLVNKNSLTCSELPSKLTLKLQN